MKHYYGVDLESWVYPDVEDFRGLNQGERKKLDGGYIIDSTCRLLELLEKHKTYLTFFILGELYEWYPQLIRKIKKAGHEIAYHTHTHVLLDRSEKINEQLKLSRDFLKEFKPKGFQAPMIYFPRGGYKILSDAGFLYSSSVYHPDINIKIIDGIYEMPVSTFRYRSLKKNNLEWPRPMNFRHMETEVPFGSSYFTAIIGSPGTALFLEKYQKQAKSAVLFIHNWQLFPPKHANYPNLKFLFKNPLYLPYLRNIKKEFETLLTNFSFGRLEDYVQLEN